MAKPPSDDPRVHTVCIRMTDFERDLLDQLRGGLSLSEWIRTVLFKKQRA